MQYRFINDHHAQAAALFCMDFRFKDAVIKFLSTELKLKKADIIVLAGASKNFANPKSLDNKKTALTQLEISAKLHHIKKIILIDHADCGAYGGLKAFDNNSELEKKEHIKNLKKAKTILAKKFKNIEIILYFANLKNKKIEFKKV